MNGDQLIRRTLWVAALSNLGGAYLFAFPCSLLGQLVGLPAETPLVYRALAALFVLLFGSSYAVASARACGRY